MLSDKADQLSSAIATEQQAKLKELQNEYTTRKQAAELAATALFKVIRCQMSVVRHGKLCGKRHVAIRKMAHIRDRYFLLRETMRIAFLCQQTLDAEAKERLVRFEAFVTDDTKQQEQRALSNFQQLHGVLSAAQPSLAEISQYVTFCKEELNNAELAKEVRAFFLKRKWRLRALLKLQDALPDADGVAESHV